MPPPHPPRSVASVGRMREPLLQQFLQLLVWVRERPEDYCSTLGELNEFLHQLYDLCAAADGNGSGYRVALAEVLAAHGKSEVAALLTDAERARGFEKGDADASRLTAFWTKLDSPLGFPSPAPC